MCTIVHYASDGPQRLNWFSKNTKRIPKNLGYVVYAPRSKSGRLIPLISRLYYWLFLKRKLPKLPGPNIFEEHKRPPFYKPAKPSDVEGFEIDDDRRDVGFFVPAGFESYLWLPNPAWKWVSPETEGAASDMWSNEFEELWIKPVTWSEVAEAYGRQMNKDTDWYEICGACTKNGRWSMSPKQNWTWAPTEQSFEPIYANAVFDVLTKWTSLDDRCLCGKWEGSSSGWDTEVKLGSRSWRNFVWSCRFGDLVDWINNTGSFDRESDLPNVIWPEDRMWFLAILYSAHSNYVAGSREIIDTILDSDVESYEIELSDHPW